MNGFPLVMYYELSLSLVSNLSKKDFDKVRCECLERRQFNGIYIMNSVGLTWLHYEEFMILKDIIELRFVVSTNKKEQDFMDWRQKLFSPTSFFQVYKTWKFLNTEPTVYLTRRDKKVIRLLSGLPQFIIESLEPQQILNEIVSKNMSMHMLINNLELSVVDEGNECDKYA